LVSTDLNRNFVTIANRADAAKHLVWSVGPAEAAKAPVVVTFDELGPNYALKTIQMGDRVTPVLDKNRKDAVSATTSISGQ